MKLINEDYINDLLTKAKKSDPSEIDHILEKARSLKRLTLKESALLLAATEPDILKKIYDAAGYVKEAIYGHRIVLFAPLYISNICTNSCLYCAFRKENKEAKRQALTTAQVTAQTEYLLKRGHKRILMVAGEAPPRGKSLVDYYCDSVKAIYDTSYGVHKIKRVNINCAPLSTEEFKKLKSSGIGTYQIFQETYHDKTYHDVHPAGPKSDPDNRLDAVDRAFTAGIDDVGIGVLYGLYDYRFETLALLSHIEHLENKFGFGPHTISVPRIEPADGSPFSEDLEWKVSDEQFKKIIAVLRLSGPYTGLILSTRESPDFRNDLFRLGISQVSAGSSTSPGGYSDSKEAPSTQFAVQDHRTLDEVIQKLIERDQIPSFCAACYRKERTGKTFMDLAKPGTIKGHCSMNALITLKEYLDDFASPVARKAGYKLINRARTTLDTESQNRLTQFFSEIDKGVRDEYV